jgi:beta-phosphoglucomutase-like phosphatase (HAD superfamily)
MGFAPERTAVIEDSVNGVIAGRAAGMTVYGFAGLFEPERLAAAGAHATFVRMADLPALLGGARP